MVYILEGKTGKDRERERERRDRDRDRDREREGNQIYKRETKEFLI